MTLNAEAQELLEKVRAMQPVLAAEAAESERLRRPTDAAIDALEKSGVFRLLVPRSYGGLEFDLDAFVEVGLTLGEVDVSLAWVTTFYIEHNWILCQFPEAFQKELFAGCDHVLAPATIAPTGEGQPVDGGYRLRGRWQWGTGSAHGSWVLVGAPSDPELGLASVRFFALPRDQVKIDDTWHVDGMCGTGSNDLLIEDVFVPAQHTAPIPQLVAGQGEGARLHKSPLYRTPMIPVLSLAASMPIVGRARAVARSFQDRLREHVRLGSGTAQAAKPAAQMHLARGNVEARQAELLLRDVATEVMALRDQASLADRGRWAASLAHAVHQSRRVIQDVALASGASIHFKRHPLQRALRDVNTATSHVVFDLDARLELYGGALLGIGPSSPLF